MALVVEDGTGLADAEAYVSRAYVTAYVAAYGLTAAAWTASASGVQEACIRKATQYLDNLYGRSWRGTKRFSVGALSWPRVDAYDDDSFLYASDELPTKLQQACAELAVRAAEGDLLEDPVEAGTVRSTRVKVGPIEEEISYSNGGNEPTASYPLVEQLLRALIAGGGKTLERA